MARVTHDPAAGASLDPPSHEQADKYAPKPAAGRKRSWGEATNIPEPGPPTPAAIDPHGGLACGEGMTPTESKSSILTDAVNPSDGWFSDEKTSDGQDATHQDAQRRINPASHKSQRVDHSIHESPALHPSSCDDGGKRAGVEDSGGAGGLVIDDFTIHLGIGWRKISNDEDIQAAARGWARFIENHFPLHRVQICLESKGLQSYLVETSEGYFLFAENLRQGRLVSRSIEGAVRNLQQTPPIFDGEEFAMKCKNSQSTEPLADTEMSLE
ncbi:hypothetical protein RJ55_03472 [Drechmeria coniospora]|nr:hypothetical protein RJ55_03472 [Drechmeria coniospora]